MWGGCVGCVLQRALTAINGHWNDEKNIDDCPPVKLGAQITACVIGGIASVAFRFKGVVVVVALVLCPVPE